MKCPEPDEFIDFLHGTVDPDIDVHLDGCTSCQSALEALYLLPLGMDATTPVPDGLVGKVLQEHAESQLRQGEGPGTRQAGTGEGLGERVTVALLASATTAFVLFGSGVASQGGPVLLLIFILAPGVFAGIPPRSDRQDSAHDR